MTKANTLLTQINENVKEKGYIPGKPETLAMAILSKRIARAKKYGKNDFNAFVLQAHNEDRNCELIQFFKFLKANLNKIPNGTRFQLAVEAGGHWSAIDIMVQAGEVNSFILDSIGSDVAWVYQSDLQRFFPDGHHYQFNSNFIGEEQFRSQIQYGPDGCQIFTEDHLEVLSRIDGETLYGALEKKAHKDTRAIFRSKHMLDDPEKISVEAHIITMNDFDKDLAFMARIFGTIESKTALNYLSEDIRLSPVGNKKRSDSDENETLIDYEKRHTGDKEVNGVLREKNLAIQHKNDRKHIKIATILSGMPDSQYNLIQKNRQGYAFIKKPSLLENNNPAKLYITKKSSKYIYKNNEFSIIEARLKSTLSTLEELMKISTNPELKVLSRKLKHNLNLYSKLLDRLNDPEKYNIDVAQIRKLEKKLKNTKNVIIILLPRANKLALNEYKRSMERYNEELSHEFSKLDYINSKLETLNSHFQKVVTTLSHSGSITENIKNIESQFKQANKDINIDNSDNIKPKMDSYKEHIKSKKTHILTPQEVTDLREKFTEAKATVEQARKIRSEQCVNLINGLAESRNAFYLLIKEIDIEIKKRTFLFSNKSAKNNALTELKSILVATYNNKDNATAQSIINSWKENSLDVIKEKRSFIFFTPSHDATKKTRTEKFIDTIEKKYGNIKF